MPSFNPISRRKILRGAGVSLALPFLNAMRPTKTMASPSSPVRLAWVFIPNGTNAERWLTKPEGQSWKVSPSLEPLADLKRDVSVFRGLSQVNARALGDGAGDHARSAATYLTGMHPLKTSGSKIRVGKSIDQVVAEAYGMHTRLPSIELGTEEGRGAGSCDSGYACAYSNNISWRSPSQPMSKEINPRRAFERLFGSSDSSGQDAARRLVMQSSILDAIEQSRKSLLKSVGEEDRHKLDEYYSSIREVEKRLDRAAEPVDLGNPKLIEEFDLPKEKGFAEQIRMMYELMVLAFRSDTTRVATFMVANEGSNRSFPMIEVKEGHHQLSHHQNKKDAIEKIAKIDHFYCQLFADFVKRLKETPDGDKTLLDNCLVMYGGAISDGNKHDHHDLPIVMAGRGGGTPSGRFYQLPSETPLNNLFLTMAQTAGVELEAIGDSTERLRLS
jgi:hypothetical protein